MICHYSSIHCAFWWTSLVLPPCDIQFKVSLEKFYKVSSEAMTSAVKQVTASKNDHSKKGSLTKKNDLLIYQSIYSNEPLCKVDLEKVHTQIGKKADQAYDRMANNRNFWMALEKYVAKEQNFDATNEVKQKQKPQVKSNKEGHKKNGINVDDDKANEMMRQMSEKIFRRTLKKHNYQMSTENFFLAEGGYGSVFRVHQKGRKYACKVISNEMFQCKPDQAGAVHSSKLRSRFDNEVQIMKRVSSHPNIIGYVDSFSDVVTQQLPLENCTLDLEKYELHKVQSEPDSATGNKIVFRIFFLVMEFANSKTLSFYVKNRRAMPENRVKNGVFWPLVSAVKFLHSQQIVHCDIKLSNVLLQSKNGDPTSGSANRRQSISLFNFEVKLCDFGLSSILDSSEDEPVLFMKPIGTAFYMAPEILRSYFCYYCRKNDSAQPYCPFKGDTWALAVCIFYCLHGFYPMDVLCKPNKHERIAELKKIFDKADSSASSKSIDEQYLIRFRGILRNCHYKLSFNCQELLRQMLEVDAKKRADIFKVAEHTYFKHM